MSDLVERIRALARDYHQHRPHYEEAADRIEALEAALREILDWDELPLRIQWIARAALAPEQDK